MTDIHAKPDIRKSNLCPPLPSNASGLDTCIYWLGIGLGSGKPKRAAGTWGTLGGLIVGVPLSYLGFIPFLVFTLLATVAGIWICERTSQLMNVHDDPHIVWDEWVGIWIGMLPLVYIASQFSIAQVQSSGWYWLGILATFVLFRLFDIAKPFPIGWADRRVSGGFGIMLDDIIAGIMAALFGLVVLYMTRMTSSPVF